MSPTALAPRILRWLLDFWKIVARLGFNVLLSTLFTNVRARARVCIIHIHIHTQCPSVMQYIYSPKLLITAEILSYRTCSS